MAHIWASSRAPNYQQWADRPTPQWFKDSKLGIFIHWGAYSVPAYAELAAAEASGGMGHIEEELVHKHNPYAEWYFNTIRFPGSEAAKYHKAHYGDSSYDELIDQWSAKDFNAGKLVDLFRRAGARYVVPTTKHHDGVTLWDAPQTGTRNTVHRGPKRDLIDELAKATAENGLKFGVYYSTGIDWHFWPTELPWHKGHYDRPGINDHAYNKYAYKHCEDLIKRHKPFVLWGDIDWPKAGVAPGEYSVESLLAKLYETNPEAVINDRFGDTHWDFCTVEYGLGEKPKAPQMWQSTRGIGFSFGYNKEENESHYMTGPEAVRLLVDVCSEGGNLLLNVGPDEAGKIPPLQLQCLEYMAEYMAINATAIHDSEEVDEGLAQPIGKEEKRPKAWVRWTRKGDRLFAFVDGEDEVTLAAAPDKVNLSSATLLSGEGITLRNGTLRFSDVQASLRPICLELAHI